MVEGYVKARVAWRQVPGRRGLQELRRQHIQFLRVQHIQPIKIAAPPPRNQAQHLFFQAAQGGSQTRESIEQSVAEGVDQVNQEDDARGDHDRCGDAARAVGCGPCKQQSAGFVSRRRSLNNSKRTTKNSQAVMIQMAS